MIFIGPYTFEIIEGKMRNLKLQSVSDEEMGPYRTDPEAPKGYSYSPAIATAYRDTVEQDLLRVTKLVYNSGYFMSDNLARSLESLAKTYEFPTIVAWFERYWEDLEKMSQTNNLFTEAKNRPNIEHDIMKQIREFKDEILLSDIGPEMRLARISYLERMNKNLSSRIKRLEMDFRLMESKDYEQWVIDQAKEFSGYEKLTGKLRSNKITIAHLRGAYDNNKTVVTDDMIRQAKRVPFDKLLKLETVGGRKRCKCPFHNEKTPSFYVYPDTNRGHCHGCGKNVDTIQYLVEVNKVEFNQAVLMLLSY